MENVCDDFTYLRWYPDLSQINKRHFKSPPLFLIHSNMWPSIIRNWRVCMISIISMVVQLCLYQHFYKLRDWLLQPQCTEGGIQRTDSALPAYLIWTGVGEFSWCCCCNAGSCECAESIQFSLSLSLFSKLNMNPILALVLVLSLTWCCCRRFFA